MIKSVGYHFVSVFAKYSLSRMFPMKSLSFMYKFCQQYQVFVMLLGLLPVTISCALQPCCVSHLGGEGTTCASQSSRVILHPRGRRMRGFRPWCSHTRVSHSRVSLFFFYPVSSSLVVRCDKVDYF